jgi:hypothetical protein
MDEAAADADSNDVVDASVDSTEWDALIPELDASDGEPCGVVHDAIRPPLDASITGFVGLLDGQPLSLEAQVADNPSTPGAVLALDECFMRLGSVELRLAFSRLLPDSLLTVKPVLENEECSAIVRFYPNIGAPERTESTGDINLEIQAPSLGQRGLATGTVTARFAAEPGGPEHALTGSFVLETSLIGGCRL